MWLSLRLVGHRIRSGPISLEQPSTQQIWGQFAEKRGLPPIYFNPRKINTYLRQKKGAKYDFVSIIAVQNSEPSIWPAPPTCPVHKEGLFQSCAETYPWIASLDSRAAGTFRHGRRWRRRRNAVRAHGARLEWRDPSSLTSGSVAHSRDRLSASPRPSKLATHTTASFVLPGAGTSLLGSFSAMESLDP